MPLHDWSDDRGWDGVRQLWINALPIWNERRRKRDATGRKRGADMNRADSCPPPLSPRD